MWGRKYKKISDKRECIEIDLRKERIFFDI
jgi:hypothetical protein